MKYLALDYETGGLYPRYHAPVSLAVVLMDDGKVVDSFDKMFPQFADLAYTPKALEVNGQKWAEIESRLHTEFDVMNELSEWTKKHDSQYLPIVAHNAEFDHGFYLSSVMRSKVDPLLGGWMCTKRIARAVLTHMKKFSLDDVLSYYAMKRTSEVHGSLEDAILTGQVFAKLMTQPQTTAPIGVQTEDV